MVESTHAAQEGTGSPDDQPEAAVTAPDLVPLGERDGAAPGSGKDTGFHGAGQGSEGTPKDQGDRPGQGAPKDQGDRPGQGTPKDQGDRPGQGTPKDQGDRPGQGTPKDQGDRPGQGTPKDQGDRPGQGTPPKGSSGQVGGRRDRSLDMCEVWPD